VLADLQSWAPTLLRGVVVSLELAFLAGGLTFGLALAVALLRIGPWRPIRILATIYVDIDRSIPLLALLIFVYFGLGRYLAQLGIPAFWVAVVAIGVNESGYLSEVYRASLQSIGKDQWEAAASLGLSRRQTIWLVIIPQAVPSAIPPTVNDLIYIIKGTSLASLISVNELTGVSNELVSETFLPMEIYLIIGVIYLLLTVPLSYLARYAERRISRRLGLRLVVEGGLPAVASVTTR
jgi:His/Glu/Gln/Arg/opine family amino acid ABC transporter permease subunit